MDLFLTNMQIFTSQDINWCYCDVFYQLFGLSFWRHPFLQICSDEEETNSSTSWIGRGRIHFQQIQFLGELFL